MCVCVCLCVCVVVARQESDLGTYLTVAYSNSHVSV